jgi:hypothetical protein
MNISEVAERMWPAWAMGLVMLALVKNSKHANLLKVDKSGLLRFAKWMVVITLIRFVMLKLLAPEEMLESIRSTVNFLPWQTTLGVFWEDMCHTVPLVILGRMYAKEKWYQYARLPLLAMVMFSFGSGHMYQGVLASCMLSLYIPITMKLGKKWGFGTVMLCHMFYDMATLLTLKWIVGA